uniref:IPTL-CTERM protein sorting domain-containing protein n=2 Tax=Candidatus Bipolaricaulota TaxID=67810 RepID=H5S9X2_9BACT|nr:hypothetical protein HGMM_F03H09C17 [uncultured Acetothermia bacterium]BAL59226.1 hypothetical protein HGMM_OP3C381 [Candidatus Acetothermum autotrophicum]
MRTVKLLAVVGLAVALVGTLALSQAQQKSNLAGISAQSIDVVFRGDPVLKLGTQRYVPDPLPANAVDLLVCFTTDKDNVLKAVNWTDQNGNKIQPAVQVPFLNAKVRCIDVDFKIGTDGTIAVSADGQRVRLTPPPNAYDIEFEFAAPFIIDDVRWTDKDGKDIGPARLKPVPTLTEWGLIALAVLLAGGMGYMIYRRRPALRPATP